MAELKPCPFWGDEAIWRGSGGWCGIGCHTDKCPAYLHALMFRTSDEAEAVWNRRASGNIAPAQLEPCGKCRKPWLCAEKGCMDKAASAPAPGVGVVQPWEVKVHCSKGERTLRAGMRWRDSITGSVWEVVEPEGGRIYSPSGLGGTPTFWCKPVEKTEAAQPWLADARADGSVSFCGDSIAAGLIATDGVPVVDGSRSE